jgi:hypothetical protein
MDKPNLVTREEAIARGFVKYYTGVPCKHGHDTYRYTTSGGCQYCVNRVRFSGPKGNNVKHFTLIFPSSGGSPTEQETLAIGRYLQERAYGVLLEIRRQLEVPPPKPPYDPNWEKDRD